jgi:hypothetical protein
MVEVSPEISPLEWDEALRKLHGVSLVEDVLAGERCLTPSGTSP